MFVSPCAQKYSALYERKVKPKMKRDLHDTVSDWNRFVKDERTIDIHSVQCAYSYLFSQHGHNTASLISTTQAVLTPDKFDLEERLDVTFFKHAEQRRQP